MDNICIDKYILIQYISKGRFGSVYKVYNKDLQINTALKIEKENDTLADESLKNEINNLKLLNQAAIHNIPVYYDSGICQDNKEYIELELFDGDLKTFSQHNVITKEELYAIIFELLYTLYEFRVIGFEHRDIKINNIVYYIDNTNRNYTLNGKQITIHNIIHPIIIDFNHSGLTVDRNKTLFKYTSVDYVRQDLHKIVRVIKKLIKITENMTNQEIKNIILFVNNLMYDNKSHQFIHDALFILKTKYMT